MMSPSDEALKLRRPLPDGMLRIVARVGAVAFSRTGDPTTGDIGDANVIRKVGDVPSGLSAL
jgi:hypothetical protein